mmetsp:Transcript_24771/g.72414  ORF Transcript_24771/g.72414 Transcript_24771/m.72414 type:complete len:261 (-) Transcript_24771:355-1137(-)
MNSFLTGDLLRALESTTTRRPPHQSERGAFGGGRTHARSIQSPLAPSCATVSVAQYDRQQRDCSRPRAHASPELPAGARGASCPPASRPPSCSPHEPRVAVLRGFWLLDDGGGWRLHRASRPARLSSTLRALIGPGAESGGWQHGALACRCSVLPLCDRVWRRRLVLQHLWLHFDRGGASLGSAWLRALARRLRLRDHRSLGHTNVLCREGAEKAVLPAAPFCDGGRWRPGRLLLPDLLWPLLPWSRRGLLGPALRLRGP